MAFYEIRFPPAISYGSSGGLGWLTRIVATQSGQEYRTQAWSKTRGEWTLSHGIKQPTDVQTLVNFFVSMQGRTHGFRFKDWNDFSDWGQGIFVLNANSQLQLAKLYTAPSPVVTGASQPTFTRFISKPVPGTVTLPGGVTLDYTTGLVTGGTAGQAWTGQFDVPVRFDTDKLGLSMDQPVGTMGTAVASSWPHIPIVEVRI